ncbi:hypothetical protein EXIGLDRAFT_736779 [Exidia glandulosa HHB12029]|uniref:Uncharacterized protein n=1 Tax=Exidia glandulosa HHB12029 TaxID=1314781 RepID=A0A165PEI5_EXIGL|nr:hypothetical protein EXIGLDRAFT_736779 [Exidia glandulosa HHB12029]
MFKPPLASTVHASRSLTFTFHGVQDDDHTVQVWTDFPAGEWHALDFEPLPTHSDAHLSLAHSSHSSHTHEARVSFAQLASPSYSFTYRILSARDGSIRWLGDQHSNGTILRSHPDTSFVLESPGWQDHPHVLGARAWGGQLPSDVARFGGPSDASSAHGFAITADGAIVRFRVRPPNNTIEFEGGAGSSGILPATDAPPLAAQLVALALFPEHDLPVLLAGDDLRLTLKPGHGAQSENNASDVHADRSIFTLHARSKVTLRRDFDASVLRACVKPLASLRPLDIHSTDFCALFSLSGSARMITVLPISSSAPSRSIVRLLGLDALADAPCALYCSGSHRAYFAPHAELSLDILTPAEGGDIVIGTVHTLADGNIVSVLQPADVRLSESEPSRSPSNPTAAVAANQRTLALRRGLLSLPALCAIAWFLITTLLRWLPPFAPVRLALALSERSERFLNERVFHLPRSSSPTSTPVANGKTVSQNGAAVPAVAPTPSNEIVLAFPRHGKKTNLVTLLVRARIADAALPALYFGSVPATVAAHTVLEPDGSTTLLQLERSVNAPTLRIVF